MFPPQVAGFLCTALRNQLGGCMRDFVVHYVYKEGRKQRTGATVWRGRNIDTARRSFTAAFPHVVSFSVEPSQFEFGFAKQMREADYVHD